MLVNGKLGGCWGAEQEVMNYSSKVEGGKTSRQPSDQAERMTDDGKAKKNV